MKKTFIAIAVLLITSVTLALVLAELLIRFTTPQLTLTQARLVSLQAFQESDFLPYELIPNLRTRHISDKYEFDYQLTTNSLGLRGHEVTQDKEKDTYRILMIGDSMTFGWGVSDQETIPALLEDLINKTTTTNNQKIEVINAGFAAGFSPDTYYLYLKKKGIRLQPDMIIINLFPRNDVSDLLETTWSQVDAEGFPSKITSAYRLVENGYIVSKFGNWKYTVPIFRNSHVGILFLTVLETKAPRIVEFIQSTLLKLPKEPLPYTEKEMRDCMYRRQCNDAFLSKWNTMESILVKMKALSDEADATMLVAILPDPDQIEQIKNNSAGAEIQPQKDVENFLGKNGIFSLNMLALIQEDEAANYFYPKDGHLTPVGTQRAAKLFLPFVIERI